MGEKPSAHSAPDVVELDDSFDADTESLDDENAERGTPRRPVAAESALPPLPDSPDEADFFPSSTTASVRSGDAADASPGGAVEGSSRLTVSWKIDGELTVGESSRASLTVSNDGGHEATDVVVRAALSDSLSIVRSSPEREKIKQFSLWRFERIPAGSTQVVELLIRGVQPGEAACVASVTSTQTASQALRIQRPELAVAVVAPESAAAGDPVAAVVEIANRGRGTVRDVRAAVELSAGLLHARGRQFEISAGGLSPGESRKLKLPLNAVQIGPQRLAVTVNASGAERREAFAELDVVGPRLSLAVRGPGLRYVDRKARYVLSVRNEGTAECSNLRLRLQPPVGFDFVQATDGGTWDSEQQSVEWFVAEVRGGAAVEVAVDLMVRRPGVHTLEARLATDQGGAVEAQTETVVDSTPKLVVEVSEQDDPVEVGVETAWEIRLRNDGSRPSTKNRVFAELPAGVQLVEARGPTKSASDHELVAFAALGELKPGARAVYVLRVIGNSSGNQRVKVRVTSAEGEPIVVEESTRFYSDR